MRRSFFLVSLFLLVVNFVFTQTGGYCGSDILLKKEIEKNNAINTKFEKFNLEWESYAIKNRSSKRGTPVVLPVIFHLMTNSYKASSVLNSEAALTKIVTMLNDVYSGKAVGDKSAGVNTNIQFCLAKIDAFGQKINSYVYDCPALNKKQLKLEESSIPSDVIQQTKKFPTNKYINIYVVEDIEGAVAGFATLPSSHGELNDGIYIEASYLTSLTPRNSTVLSHEMGHYLGLLHTFGRCSESPELTLKACACDNSNCLVDGDMVCDTPPDFSIQAPKNCSSPPSTCNTDALSTVNDPNAPFPTKDINDLVNNYMDYGNWDCQYTFTQGQINRMHYSIDPTVGARNSLLNSSVCNVICEEVCKLSIKSPVANTLQLTNNQVKFDFKNNSCEQYYEQLNWKVIDLSTNQEIISNKSSEIAFNKLGNFRILLEAKNPKTLCIQTQSIDIQVLPASNCLPNYDLSKGWGTEWKRVEIDGGWQRNTSNNFIFKNAVQRNDQTTTRTAIVTSLESDPNFKNIKNPQGITNIFRVGDIINDKTVRIDGAATYVTYTFTPTPSNSKFRVYYIGMKHNSKAGGDINYQNFTTGDYNGTQSAFGYISHYEIKKSDGQKLLLQPIYNKNHEGFNNLNDSPHESKYEFIPSTSLPEYKIMPNWKYTDLDFSEYSCGNTTVTVTFYALTDTGNSPGHLQSYGYFAIGNCSAGIPKEIELTNKNYYMGCGSCISLEIPPAYDYYGYYLDKVFDVSVQESTDNESWNNYIFNINGNSKLYLNLCKTPDKNKFKYFKITYKKVCGNEKTATVVIEQGFEHTPEPPCDNSGTLLKIEDKYFQYCEDKSTLPDLNLNDPCWVTDKKQGKYKWQYTSSNQPDITNAIWYDIQVWDKVEQKIKLITTKDFKPSSPDIDFLDCGTYVRRIAFYEDPYCPGIPIEVPSDIVHYTDLRLAFSGNIKNDDVCGNIQTNVKITDIYFPNCFSHDLEINDKMSKGPHSVTFTAKINGKKIGEIIKDVTNRKNFASIDFPFLDTNILKNGDNNIVIEYNYKNVLGCDNKGTILGSIHRNPSAIGGTISLDKNTCSQTVFKDTNDNNDEFKNPWGYVWEYSYDNFNKDIQSFPSSNSSGFTLPADITYPVYIRRKAFGPKTNCVTPAYSKVQFIDKKASKDNFLVSVEKFCPGQDAKLTISNSNFPIPFTIKTAVGQTNTEQQVLNNNNLPIQLNLTNITTNTTISITLSDSKCSETKTIELIPEKAANIVITSSLKTPVFDEKKNLYTLNFCFSDDLKNHKITASPSFSKYNWTSSLDENVVTSNNIPGTTAALYNLKVTDDFGCSNETNVKVTDSPEIKGELNSYYCDNTKYLSVDNLVDTTLYNYEWSYTKLVGSPIKIGSNNFRIKDNLIVSTTLLPIKYYVKLTDKNGCSKNLGPVLIKKRDISITNVKNCIDGELNLAISPINFSIKQTESITATLNPDVYKSSILNNVFNIKINPAKNKTYTIKYNNNGCEINKTYLPSYFEQPKIQFTATIDDLGVDIYDQPYPYEDRVSTVTGCGRNASITATGSGNFPLKYKLFGIFLKNYFLFNWKYDDQSFLSEKSPTPNIYSTIVKIPPSEKVYTVSMTDANNCSVTKKIKHISVENSNLSVSYDNIVCNKEDKLLKLTPYLINCNVTVFPINLNSKVKIIKPKSEYSLTAGSYQVIVTGTYKCQNRSYPVVIKNNGPIKINNLDLYYLDKAYLDLNAEYVDINNNQSGTVIWTSDKLSDPVNGGSIRITKEGYYTLTVIDKCGVKATKKIQVVKRQAITKSNREESFEINPNPNKGVFYLTFENEVKLLNVYVYNVQGKLLYIPDMIDKSGGVNQKLDLSNQNLSSGLYFVHVQTENNYLIKNLIIE